MHRNDSTVTHRLERLAARVIDDLTEQPTAGICEGKVMTVGPPPYRRLDCDSRALAYIRSRPRKRAVRIDISALWDARHECPLRIQSSSSAATLMLASDLDVDEAVSFIREAVARTRAAHKKHGSPYDR